MRPLTLLLLLVLLTADTHADTTPRPRDLRVGRLAPTQGRRFASYPGALESLLEHVRQRTAAPVAPEPLDITDFADPRLLQLPLVYANFADREDWSLSPAEATALKGYLQRGGLLFIDAGITAAFLRTNRFYGQHHSFAEWDVHPELAQTFRKLFPNDSFKPLRRSDPLFAAFYSGLPDPRTLPETVRDYTQREKWPGGSYAALALTLNGRPAVIAMPIIAMGWGVSPTGHWLTHISMRILENADGLSDFIGNASYSGERFEVRREDGALDTIFCESEAKPSWNREPSGRTRVFRYYSAPEINDYVHHFYTRLGTNVIIYALTH